MNNDLNLGLLNEQCYSMNNICQRFNIQKIIPFLPSLPLFFLSFFLSNWVTFLRQKLAE